MLIESHYIALVFARPGRHSRRLWRWLWGV